MLASLNSLEARQKTYELRTSASDSYSGVNRAKNPVGSTLLRGDAHGSLVQHAPELVVDLDDLLEKSDSSFPTTASDSGLPAAQVYGAKKPAGSTLLGGDAHGSLHQYVPLNPRADAHGRLNECVPPTPRTPQHPLGSTEESQLPKLMKEQCAKTPAGSTLLGGDAHGSLHQYVPLNPRTDAHGRLNEYDPPTPRTPQHPLGSTEESQLLKLMKEQCARLGAIEKSLEGAVQGISEQHIQRLEESFKRYIEEALHSNMTPIPEMNGRPTVPATVDMDPKDSEQQIQRLEESFKRYIEEALQSRTTPIPETNGRRSVPATVDMDPKDPKEEDVRELLVGLDLTTSPPSFELESNGAQKEGNAGADSMFQRTMWEMGQLGKREPDNSWYGHAFRRATVHRTNLHELLIRVKLDFLIPVERPDNFLVCVVDMYCFHLMTVTAIIANTIFSAYHAHQTILMAMEASPSALPLWWDSVDLAFTVYFICELVLRMLAFRGFFFVAPGLWAWNLLDLFVCTISVLAKNIDLVFLRLLRIFRMIRLLKVVAQSSELAELRTLLFAIVACIVPLFWAVAFLVITIIMFSILILQCISSQSERLHDDAALHEEVFLMFYGFPGVFKTLCICLAGSDWVASHDSLSSFGSFYGAVVPFFVVFVNIGVCNIVIGVFSDALNGCKDRVSIANMEMTHLNNFTEEMVKLAKEAEDKYGSLKWDQFKDFFKREDVQAYMAHHGLDASRAQLFFHLLDKNKNECVELREFVVGMLKLKGVARHFDQHIQVNALQAVMTDVHQIRCDIENIRRQA